MIDAVGGLDKRIHMYAEDHYRVVRTSRNNKHNMDAEPFTGCPMLPMDVMNAS